MKLWAGWLDIYLEYFLQLMLNAVLRGYDADFWMDFSLHLHYCIGKLLSTDLFCFPVALVFRYSSLKEHK